MNIDPYILAFSAFTVIATIWMGFWSARKSKTAHDFFVAGRSVSVGWNASAISGEYLSAASFMGVAGMVMKNGYDALWYPVCYACGYLFLLLFIAGPLRRFGAYTIPDFAEGRYDSPLFRKIAVVFVLFIGFFYTMPQMKGAGTTLAYIFPGLPYWAGVVLVGSVITLNVALGGMKGITLVQAFQYWAKMFAISVPIFVLMAIYGHYGRQIEINHPENYSSGLPPLLAGTADTPRDYRKRISVQQAFYEYADLTQRQPLHSGSPMLDKIDRLLSGRLTRRGILKGPALPTNQLEFASRKALPDQVEGTGSNLYSTSMSLAPRAGAATVISVQHIKVLGSAASEPLDRSFHDNVARATRRERVFDLWRKLNELDIELIPIGNQYLAARTREEHPKRQPLPDKAPKDGTWLNPFGPLTTKAAKTAAAALTNRLDSSSKVPLRPGLTPDEHLTVNLAVTNVPEALAIYADLSGRQLLPRTNGVAERMDDLLSGQLSRWHLIQRKVLPDSGLTVHRDGILTAGEAKQALDAYFTTNSITLVPVGQKYFRAVETPSLDSYWRASAAERQQAWLQTHERPLALLYTYSLIIALVCGTAGLPHILVRFYTNPDGAAAKRTTMWVMILIGVFYLFPPVFGVMGRNLSPELYAATGAKGTDKVVLELPRILNAPTANPQSAIRNPQSNWGSILSGITCAGAFAAFMSTFSGLLVSMTGALAHDVYGRIIRPQSTPAQRLRAFKVAAVVIGGVAILLGMQVEQFDINFMVGQAFAIAAASYFPLLFLSAWWRNMTMPGAAAGMLGGGVLALTGISLTSFTDLKWIPLDAFWASHPLLRILCEQPAIWTVPLAITLMIVVSKLTRRGIPSDVRMKMLVLHAPEKLGLKQEYIQEHQPSASRS